MARLYKVISIEILGVVFNVREKRENDKKRRTYRLKDYLLFDVVAFMSFILLSALYFIEWWKH